MSYLKPRNLLLVLALCLALVLVVVITLRFSPESQLQEVVKALPEGVDIALEEIDYTHIEGGQSRWRLVARQVKRQSGTKLFAVSNPELQFFNEEGVTEGQMQAGRGEVSEDYQQVRLFNDVVLKNSSGYTFTTDRLDYDHATKVASTKSKVHLTSEDLILEGTGMEFFVQQDRVLLHSGVYGKINAD